MEGEGGEWAKGEGQLQLSPTRRLPRRCSRRIPDPARGEGQRKEQRGEWGREPQRRRPRRRTRQTRPSSTSSPSSRQPPSWEDVHGCAFRHQRAPSSRWSSSAANPAQICFNSCLPGQCQSLGEGAGCWFKSAGVRGLTRLLSVLAGAASVCVSALSPLGPIPRPGPPLSVCALPSAARGTRSVLFQPETSRRRRFLVRERVQKMPCVVGPCRTKLQ